MALRFHPIYRNPTATSTSPTAKPIPCITRTSAPSSTRTWRSTRADGSARTTSSLVTISTSPTTTSTNVGRLLRFRYSRVAQSLILPPVTPARPTAPPLLRRWALVLRWRPMLRPIRVRHRLGLRHEGTGHKLRQCLLRGGLVEFRQWFDHQLWSPGGEGECSQRKQCSWSAEQSHPVWLERQTRSPRRLRMGPEKGWQAETVRQLRLVHGRDEAERGHRIVRWPVLAELRVRLERPESGGYRS